MIIENKAEKVSMARQVFEPQLQWIAVKISFLQ